MHNATGLQHTEGHLLASRHQIHPFMVDSKPKKGPKPSPLPKCCVWKLELSAEAPGTPRSPRGEWERRLHARGGGAGSTMVPGGAAAAAPCPLVRRALSSSCKLSGSAANGLSVQTKVFSGLSPRAPTPARARTPHTHSRSSLPTMTILRAPTPAPSTSPVPRRGSGPEIFTFDPLPEPAVAPAARPSASRGLRKRSRRVLYPRVVRRQLPVEDPNPAKKLLFLLLTIVFCQILMAEEGVSAPLAPEDTPSAPSPAPTAAPPVLEPLNLTSEPSDYALDLSTFLQQHPAAF